MTQVSLAAKGTMTLALIVSAVFALSLWVTNPVQLGPPGVTLWFLGLALVLAFDLSTGIYALSSRFTRGAAVAIPEIRRRNAIRLGVLLGSGISILLALSSLHQLDIRDIALVAILTGLIEFYMRTR